MRVQAVTQCDVSFNGKVTALFPEQVYDFPEEAVTDLLGAGSVRAFATDTGEVVAPVVRVRSRARAKK